MELNELEKIRVEKIRKLEDLGISAYPTRANVTATIKEACDAFESAEAAGNAEPVKFTIAGRMRSQRVMGKLAFTHIDRKSTRLNSSHMSANQ